MVEEVEGRVEVMKEDGCKGGVVFKGGRGVRYVDYVMDKVEVMVVMWVGM